MRFILILCAVLALSSIASESADQKTKSKQVGPDKHQGSAQNVERATNNQPEKPSPFQTELIEALAGIEHEQWMHWSHTAAGEVSDATRKQVATVVGGLR